MIRDSKGEEQTHEYVVNLLLRAKRAFHHIRVDYPDAIAVATLAAVIQRQDHEDLRAVRED